MQYARIEPDADNIYRNHNKWRQQRQAPGTFPAPDSQHDACQRGQKSQNLIREKSRVDIDISGAIKVTIFGKEQLEAVQIKAGGDHTGEDS